MGEKNRGLFLAMVIVMFILFLSLINIVFDLTGVFFIFEFLLLLILLLAGVIFTARIIHNSDNWMWSGLMVFFGINLVNISCLFWINANFSDVILPLTVGAAGFVIALVKKGSEKEQDDVTEEERPAVKEAPKIEDIKVNFSPGKYVASEIGKKYHIPKCDFAKKINKNNIVWFDDKSDAKRKGYMPCKCIE